jgi:hypothetical protein
MKGSITNPVVEMTVTVTVIHKDHTRRTFASVVNNNLGWGPNLLARAIQALAQSFSLRVFKDETSRQRQTPEGTGGT